MKLRPYQEDIIVKIKKAWKDGFKTPCIVAPCGAGKSILIADMAKKTTANKKRVLFIVHRKELCDQIRNTFEMYGVDMDYCTINMIQTLVKRTEEIETPDLILVDENHHSKASSYIKIFDKFINSYRIGVTATPIRLNGEGFKDINDILIESVSAKWLIENNFLSPAKVYSTPLIDVKSLKTKAGDYDQKQVEAQLNNNTIYGDILKTWRNKANNKKTIIYCSTVNHSLITKDIFASEGISCEHIDGKTNKKDRDKIIEKFRSGEIQMLTNCDIVSEGFDIPDCECVILLRPTKSLTLYIQQSMRCMRFKEGKQGIILDHVANTFQHGLPWQDREWTLEGKKRKKGNKEKNEEKVWECEYCYAVWEKKEGRICPECGEEISITEREIKKKEYIELIEIKEDMFKKSRKQKREEFKNIQEQMKYKKGWIWYQMKNFDEKEKRKINKLKEELEKI